MNRNNGFTLVELLAVIVILSTILVIGAPTLVSNIKNQKSKASGYVCDIIKTAAKNYGIDYGIEGRQSISISDLCERYISCPITDPNTNEEIEGYLLINDDECNFLSTVKLDITLNGGTPAQSFKERYGQYYTIRLLPPTKENNDFVEWRVVRGNSTIDDNILKFGDTDTEIFAVWQSWPTLTLDLDEGTIENNFGGIYKSGTIIELTNPTKEGYIFSGWVVASDNSVVSGNTFTMGSEDTTLKATWIPETLMYSYSCANTRSGEEPYKFTYTGNCVVVDEGDYNWVIKFTSGGTFTTSIPSNIDLFLVGGGGGGGNAWSGGCAPTSVGGGGRGYAATYTKIAIAAGTPYKVAIGGGGGGAHGCEGRSSGNGGSSSGFGYSVNGGKGATSGGSGGSSVYEFNDSSRPRTNAGGGGGGSFCCDGGHSGGDTGRPGTVMIRNAR